MISCSAPESGSTTPSLKSLEIPFIESAITVDGSLDEAGWRSAATVDPFEFSWWKEGKKEGTRAKLLWDNDFLYVSFVCEDAHIWAEHTKRDTPVYKDDCVEVFVSPDPDRLMEYYNVEMNAKGVSLDFLHPEGPGSKVAWDPEVQIATTIVGSLNDDNDLDRQWILEAAIPFKAFSDVAKNTPPHSGDEWRLNLHRLGGKTNPQFSQWSPSVSEEVLFHAPQFFGRVRFIK